MGRIWGVFGVVVALADYCLYTRDGTLRVKGEITLLKKSNLYTHLFSCNIHMTVSTWLLDQEQSDHMTCESLCTTLLLQALIEALKGRVCWFAWSWLWLACH